MSAVQVFANYGAMSPVAVLSLKSFSDGRAVAVHEDGHEEIINVDDVRHARPTSGSPIGLYWNRRDAY